jgi:mannitol/fructose-specific phosphotransferase system IIA component (Ntr-type)
MERPMTDQEFKDLFKEELYIADLKAGNKQEVLEEFADLLYHAGKVSNRSIVLEMLSRRERLGSTAIGKGLAIPHGRTLMAQELIVAFGRCREGLDFDAPDHHPVRLFFLIIAPYRERQQRYLPALGKIAELFQSEKLRNEILKADHFEEFIDALSSESDSQRDATSSG